MRVIVIGGGAAGMTAAVAAGRRGHSVVLLEKNRELGKKLLVTGNGRCNLTNSRDMDEILQHVVSNRKFLYHAFHTFTNRDLLNLLEEAGLKTKVEENGRVFPVSDRAEDVRNAWIQLLKKEQVDIRCGCRAEKLLVDPEGRFCTGVETSEGGQMAADWVIVTAGGMAAPALGADGDGCRMAAACGHRIVPCRPALVPLKIQEDLRGLQGVSLPDVRLQIRSGKKTLAENRGPVMITHYGLSGPAVLNLSSYYLSKDKGEKSVRIRVDFLPDQSREETDEFLLDEQKRSPHKSMKNIKIGEIPQAALERLLQESGIAGDQETGMLKRKERNRLVENLHALQLTVSGTAGFREAVITQGGVKTSEIDGKTMTSRICGGLKFAGEVLDLDAETGGYNLQIAWSTGWTAGITI